MAHRHLKSAFSILLLVLLSAANSICAQDQAIYTDSLQNGWQDWGWTQINYNNTSPVHSGSRSISVTITQAWQAIYIARSAFNCSTYTNLVFWLHGGASGGQQLQIQGHAGGAARTAFALAPPTANTWTKYTVSLASIGVANRTDMDGFWIQAMDTAATDFLPGRHLVGHQLNPIAHREPDLTDRWLELQRAGQHFLGGQCGVQRPHDYQGAVLQQRPTC